MIETDFSNYLIKIFIRVHFLLKSFALSYLEVTLKKKTNACKSRTVRERRNLQGPQICDNAKRCYKKSTNILFQ